MAEYSEFPRLTAEDCREDTHSSNSQTAVNAAHTSVMVLKCLLAKDVAADHGVKTTKATLLEAVTKQFADIEKEPLYSLATVIVPRYKDRFFSEGFKTETHRLLLRLMTEGAQRDPNLELEFDNTGEPAENVSRSGSSSSMFSEILAEETTQQARADSATPSEMIIYFSEPSTSECITTGILENQ